MKATRTEIAEIYTFEMLVSSWVRISLTRFLDLLTLARLDTIPVSSGLRKIGFKYSSRVSSDSPDRRSLFVVLPWGSKDHKHDAKTFSIKAKWYCDLTKDINGWIFWLPSSDAHLGGHPSGSENRQRLFLPYSDDQLFLLVRTSSIRALAVTSGRLETGIDHDRNRY